MSIFDSMFGVNKQKHANDEKNKKGKQHESVMPNITDATDESTPTPKDTEVESKEDQSKKETNVESKKEQKPNDDLAEKEQPEQVNQDKKEIKLGSMTFEKKTDPEDGKNQLVQKDVKTKEPEKFSKPICIKFTFNGKKIANDYLFSGKLGDKLTREQLPKLPDGYKLPDDYSVDMELKEQKQTLVLKLQRNSVKYRIVPVNKKGEPINQGLVKEFNGVVGEKISASRMPKVDGYHLYKGRTYTVPNESRDLKVYYGPNEQKIPVIYQTNTGEILTDAYVSGKTGEEYDIHPERQSFTGYELDEESKKLVHGKFDGKTRKITLKYNPIKCSVKVSFVDESGNQIHDPLIQTGHYKEPYFIQLPTNDGYEYAGLTEELSRVFTQASDKVVLRFKRATVSFKINFWFDKEHRQSAHEPKKVSGLVGNLYNEEIPIIDGYKPNIERVSGKFDALKNPDIDVVYSKVKCTVEVLLEDETGRLLSKDNNLLKPIVQTGNWGERFNIKLPEIAGYIKPKNLVKGKFNVPKQTIEINYQAKEVTLTVNYIDSKTKKPIPTYTSDVTKVLAGSSYTADPLNIDGFLLKDMPKNSSGVVGADPIVVNFMYEPKKSTVILHYNDQTLVSLSANDKKVGYFNEEYDLKPKEIPGFKFVSSSSSLKGKFPAGRLDIYLTYEAQEINFTLVPVNQYGDVIDDIYNQKVVGLVKQTFSVQMPEIPGFKLDKHIINGHISSEYDKKVFPIQYLPLKSDLIVHTLIQGGNKDGQQPFKDEILQGDTDQRYVYNIKQLTGYHTDKKSLEGRFGANTKDLTVSYFVNREEYQIIFVNKDKTVGAMPKNKGYYDQGVEIENSIPNGYHLPDGLSDAQVRLNGSKEYRVEVLPKTIMIDLVAETEDGMPLEKTREVQGYFREAQTVDVPIVDGYQPVNGKTIKLDFNLEKGNHEIIPIKYKAEARKITVRYISTLGENIAEPVEITGVYNGQYEAKPKKIRGYFAIDTSVKRGTFGLKNSDIAFIYREGSDKFSKATASFDDIITQQSSTVKDDDTQVVYNDNNQQMTEEYLADDFDNEATSQDSGVQEKLNEEPTPKTATGSNIGLNPQTQKIQNMLKKASEHEKQIQKVNVPNGNSNKPKAGNLLHKFDGPNRDNN